MKEKVTPVVKPSEEKIDRLVEQAQTGDAESFSELYDILLDPIFKFCFFRVPTEEIAEDITSDIFIQVWRSLPTYTKTKGIKFSSWVFRIAQNKIIDFFRKHKDTLELKEELNIESKPVLDATSSIENKLLRKHLNSALKKIPESQAESLILRYFSELSNAEIAEVMEKTETAVRILQSRGIKAIKKYIDF